MKKIISTIICALIVINLLSLGQNAFASSQNLDSFDFLVGKWVIKKSEKPLLDNYITRAKFWKVALELAWYKELKKDKKSSYSVPIKWIESNAWYSKYSKEAYRLWLLNDKKKSINPLGTIKKLETLWFVFKLFWVSTPYFNDVIMDFKDVVNDHPIVSKCLIINMCKWEEDQIFWANKPLKASDAYDILANTYKYVYEDTNNITSWLDSNWIDILKQMIESIGEEYYKQNMINIQEMMYSAMEWFAESLWDNYTVFMRPENSESFNEDIDWSFEWIWAYIEKHDEWIKIITPINWGPAQAAWLKANDIILEADWFSLENLQLKNAVSKIKWPKGSSVKLKIKRWNEMFYKNVVRSKVEIPSLETSVDWGMLIVKINQFNKNTDEELEKILLENSKFSSIIFDVRSNPGWYLDTVENILSFFVEEWETIVQVQYPKVKINNKSWKWTKIIWKKIAVLIDDASASASEILAWTLQDYWIATVVWEKSFWKWTVQTIEQYYDWSQFKYTIAQWLTAKWNSIDWTWVTPNINMVQDPNLIWDEVLERGKRAVR